MKERRILASIMTIALCGSLVTGATYALFTDTSESNIAITSGKIDVEANIQKLTLYSPTGIYEDGTVGNATNGATQTTATSGSFASGGTASVENGADISLVNMMPGDKVEFEIQVANHSGVAIQYYTVVGGTDNGLLSALEIEIGGQTVGEKEMRSSWNSLPVGGNVTVNGEIALPINTLAEEYMGKECSVQFAVVALQGNAMTAGSVTELQTLFAEAKAASVDGTMTVTLDKDYNAAGWKTFDLTGVKTLTVDGAGKKLVGLDEVLLANITNEQESITVKNLTVDGANLTQTTEAVGYGLITSMATGATVTLTDCKICNSTIRGLGRTGAFVGWTDTAQVFASKCVLKGSTVSASNAVGGIIGHAGASNQGVFNATDCTVEESKLTSYDDGYRVGAIVGTANMGTVTITRCSSVQNTMLQDNQGTTIARPQGQSDLYGRLVADATGRLTIDGVEISA